MPCIGLVRPHCTQLLWQNTHLRSGSLQCYENSPSIGPILKSQVAYKNDWTFPIIINTKAMIEAISSYNKSSHNSCCEFVTPSFITSIQRTLPHTTDTDWQWSHEGTLTIFSHASARICFPAESTMYSSFKSTNHSNVRIWQYFSLRHSAMHSLTFKIRKHATYIQTCNIWILIVMC